MTKIRGNIVQLTGLLMSLYPAAKAKAEEFLREKTGKNIMELSFDDQLDVEVMNFFLSQYVAASPSGERAIVTLGRNIYPAIKKAGQIPPEVDSILKLVKFEAEGFKLYHEGPDVVQRKFLVEDEGHVVVDAPSPGYDCRLIEGVFLGIIELFGKKGQVTQTRCVRHGDSTCEYDIRW